MFAIVLVVAESIHIGSNEHDFLDHYVTRHTAKRQPSISCLCLLPGILFRSTILLVGPERHARFGDVSQAITKYRSAGRRSSTCPPLHKWSVTKGFRDLARLCQGSAVDPFSAPPARRSASAHHPHS
jgi:hypothetical protein